MILENNKRDFISEQQEDTKKMSISADVESHIIKVLTEHSYDDPLGSSIREAVSNAVDSVTEAGTNEPVMVSLKKNVSGIYELIIEDKGLGLDEASFYKYIMGLGESTKRNSSVLLGGYGAGAKAWLSYTNNFSFVCRKDGIERKYLIFKGEEYPEATKLYEKPTTEVNGVQVIVALKNNYLEVSNVKNKIKEQLAYLDNVYYDIEGFDNSYKVYRSKDFQFSSLSCHNEMHISLKNIYYSIDWSKIGLKPINCIPVALRFDDYEDLKPIFNRESIQYNAKSIEAIKKKVIEVCDWFVNKYNEEIKEFSTFTQAYDHLISLSKTLNIFDKTFLIAALDKYSTIAFDSIKVTGINYKRPLFYAQNMQKLIKEYEPVCSYNYGTLKFKHIGWIGENAIMKSPQSYLPILVGEDFKGNLKQFLIDKYSNTRSQFLLYKKRSFYKLKKKSYSFDDSSLYHLLQLDNHHKSDWRAVIQEANKVVTEFVMSKMKDETKTAQSKEFLDYVLKKQEQAKLNRKKSVKNSVLLNKEEGEVTIYKARTALRVTDENKGISYDKDKISIKNLKTLKKLVVYCSVKEDFDAAFIKGFVNSSQNRVIFVKFNSTEIDSVKDLKNLMTFEKFMESKALAKVGTYYYVKALLSRDIPKIDNLQGFTNVLDIKKELKKYRDSFNFASCHKTQEAILEHCKENNLWDQTIMPQAKQYEKFLLSVGFLNYFTNPITDIDKKIINNITYIILKRQKIDNALVSEYDLVVKPKEEEVTDEENPFEEAVLETADMDAF